MKDKHYVAKKSQYNNEFYSHIRAIAPNKDTHELFNNFLCYELSCYPKGFYKRFLEEIKASFDQKDINSSCSTAIPSRDILTFVSAIINEIRRNNKLHFVNANNYLSTLIELTSKTLDLYKQILLLETQQISKNHLPLIHAPKDEYINSNSIKPSSIPCSSKHSINASDPYISPLKFKKAEMPLINGECGLLSPNSGNSNIFKPNKNNILQTEFFNPLRKEPLQLSCNNNWKRSHNLIPIKTRISK
jgi:hypothetical protein